MPKNSPTNTVRITSGSLKARTIKTPPNHTTHPMGARERLALFNIISPLGVLDSVLDAFAGSGAIGIEALSRGAKNAVFVESNHIAANTIRENIKNLGLEAITSVLEEPVEQLSGNNRYTLVVADPPYDNYNPQIIEHLLPLVDKNGIFVLSHPKHITPLPSGFSLLKHASYANANLSIFQRDIWIAPVQLDYIGLFKLSFLWYNSKK